MNNSFPARLHAVFASDSPLAVVFRRGPSKQVCTFLWNREDDTFIQGQWLKGKIYERRCDLSPDGKYLLYFAMNGKWDSETKGSWTAISRAPWLKAVALYAKGDCWEGGGLFLSKNSYWLNDRYWRSDNTLKVTKELHHEHSYVPEGGYSGKLGEIQFGAEDTGVYYRRLLRDGWQFVSLDNNPASSLHTVFEKKLPKGWSLNKKAFAGMPDGDGRGCYWDEHVLVNSSSNLEIDHDDWEWAEIDRETIVWASKGCLYRAAVNSADVIGEPKLLCDFNDYAFKEIMAPY